jgi:hypothetical protein
VVHDDDRLGRGRPLDDDARKLSNRGGRGGARDDRVTHRVHVLRGVLDDDRNRRSLHGNRGVGGRKPQGGSLAVRPEQMPGQEQ